MQFPSQNYQPVPAATANPYQQPPANLLVGQPQAPPRGNDPDIAAPKKKKGIESSEVALNEHGGLTRCLYYMIIEDGPLLPANGVEKTDNMSYLRSCMVRWAVIPMGMETVFLYYLCYEVNHHNWAEENQQDFEGRCVSILAIAIYYWTIMDLFFSSTLHQFTLLTRGHYRSCNRCVAVLLFILEIALHLSLLVAGSLWVGMNSSTPLDAILNALALNYIVEIDDYVTSFTTSMGGYTSAHVPSTVVLSESNADWPRCFQKFVCISNNLVLNPILPLLWAYVTVILVDGGIMVHKFDLYFFLMLEAIFILTSDMMCRCCRCLCCCRKDVDTMDSSSSEAYNL